jgi:hypothetical protein
MFFGKVVMHNKTDIGFIDTHAKSDSRNDHTDIVPDKGFLDAGAVCTTPFRHDNARRKFPLPSASPQHPSVDFLERQ